MSRRIEIELTSARSDGTWTWRAAGAREPKGVLEGSLLPSGAKTGDVLWKFQTGFGADAPPVVYEVDGDQYIAIVTGGNSIQRSATGDAVWAFSLKGTLGPSLWPPRPPSASTGPSIWWRIWGAIAPLWLPHEGAEHINEPPGQGAQGDRGDR